MNTIELQPISGPECEKLVKQLSEYFPMCLEYFEKDPVYTSEEVEWWQFIFVDIAYVPAALACFRERGDTLHMSVFEVSKPCRGNGRGTEIMECIIQTAINNKYHAITLQLREPKLATFYGQFGFMHRTSPEGIPFMQLDLGN